MTHGVMRRSGVRAFGYALLGTTCLVSACGESSRNYDGKPVGGAATGGTSGAAGGTGANGGTTATTGGTSSSMGGTTGNAGATSSSTGGIDASDAGEAGSTGGSTIAGNAGTVSLTGGTAGLGGTGGTGGTAGDMTAGSGAAAGMGGTMPLTCATPPGCTALQPGVVAAGEQHTCALVGDGTAKCWGHNYYGQLGTEEMQEAGASAATVPGVGPIKDLAATDYGTCALLEEGTVTCWGFAPLSTNEGAVTPVEGLDHVTMIAAGGNHVCALRDDGTVWCWGANDRGETGGTEEVNPDPRQMERIEDATFIAGGDSHNCAIVGSGSVKCWGNNAHGQLGTNETMWTPEPVPVADVDDAAMLALGRDFSCALTKSFGLKCWGEGAVGDPGNVIAIAAHGENACAVRVDGAVFCFGNNTSGQLGLGDEPALGTAVLAVPGLDFAKLTGISLSSVHVCLVTGKRDLEREAWCWGNGLRGQLGIGSSNSTKPVQVPYFP